MATNNLKYIMIIGLPLLICSTLLTELEINQEGIWLLRMIFFIIFFIIILCLLPEVFDSPFAEDWKMIISFLIGLFFLLATRYLSISGITEYDPIQLLILQSIYYLISIGFISFSISYFINRHIISRKNKSWEKKDMDEWDEDIKKILKNEQAVSVKLHIEEFENQIYSRLIKKMDERDPNELIVKLNKQSEHVELRTTDSNSNHYWFEMIKLFLNEENSYGEKVISSLLKEIFNNKINDENPPFEGNGTQVLAEYIQNNLLNEFKHYTIKCILEIFTDYPKPYGNANFSRNMIVLGLINDFKLGKYFLNENKNMDDADSTEQMKKFARQVDIFIWICQRLFIEKPYHQTYRYTDIKINLQLILHLLDFKIHIRKEDFKYEIKFMEKKRIPLKIEEEINKLCDILNKFIPSQIIINSESEMNDKYEDFKSECRKYINGEK